jgi:hypothetical protein
MMKSVTGLEGRVVPELVIRHRRAIDPAPIVPQCCNVPDNIPVLIRTRVTDQGSSSKDDGSKKNKKQKEQGM